jgi:hypothetical protein
MNKKEVLIKKYIKMNQDLSAIMDCSFLPKIEDVDILDIVLYFKFTFSDISETQYKQALIDLLYFQNIKNIDIDKIYPVVHEFIIWFKFFIQ